MSRPKRGRQTPNLGVGGGPDNFDLWQKRREAGSVNVAPSMLSNRKRAGNLLQTGYGLDLAHGFGLATVSPLRRCGVEHLDILVLAGGCPVERCPVDHFLEGFGCGGGQRVGIVKHASVGLNNGQGALLGGIRFAAE